MNKKSDLYEAGVPSANAEEKKDSALSEKGKTRIKPTDDALTEENKDYWLDEEYPAEDS